MLVCAISRTYCTRDRGCSAHPVSPAPFVGRGCFANLGQIRPRECELISINVIASEAKQSIVPRKERMDCFVASAPRNDADGRLKIESGFLTTPRIFPPALGAQRTGRAFAAAVSPVMLRAAFAEIAGVRMFA